MASHQGGDKTGPSCARDVESWSFGLHVGFANGGPFSNGRVDRRDSRLGVDVGGGSAGGCSLVEKVGLRVGIINIYTYLFIYFLICMHFQQLKVNQ